jgi:hypothetical protein
MAIRRISDNMMLNANNSFRIIWLFFQRRSDWKNNRIKAIYGTGKYRVHIINQTNEVIKDFEVNVQSKKKKFALDINILLKLEIDNEPCLLIVVRHHRTQESYRRFKSKQSANDFQCNVKKIRTIFSQI